MLDKDTEDLAVWVAAQVDRYEAVRADYELLGGELGTILREIAARVAPLSLVQVRVKSVPSFAEKSIRKRAARADPVSMFTDLCGARVICRTPSEVRAVCAEIVRALEVDWENSADVGQRLMPTEFGYRSIHYIVQLPVGAADPGRSDRPAYPADLLGLKAEVQVRTFAEHAYGDFHHDLTYKGAFELPRELVREVAAAAAALEEADQAFDRIETEIARYRSRFGRYLDESAFAAEMGILTAVLAHAQGSVDVAQRLARLALSAGQWELAASTLAPFAPPEAPGARDDAEALGSRAAVAVARDLGTALCRLYHADRAGEAYRRGQHLLERAATAGDLDAMAELAETWLGTEDDRARVLYQRVLEADPSAPGPLARFLALAPRSDPGLVPALGSVLRAAISRCDAQIAAGVGLPASAMDQGLLLLITGEIGPALAAYALGTARSTAESQIRDALAALRPLTAVASPQSGASAAGRMLALGLAARFPSAEATERVRALANPHRAPLAEPVVLVAGAAGQDAEKVIADYGPVISSAFSDFTGTVISGGTTSGICGLVGAIGAASGGRIRTIGYRPKHWPGSAVADVRYSEARELDAADFSPADPLEAWVDIIASGIAPAQVKLIGISGGAIAAVEYRVALALGAPVAILVDSGREAGRLLADARWQIDRPLRMPRDAESLKAFLASPASVFEESVRSSLGKIVHEESRAERSKRPDVDQALVDWELLSKDFRKSSLEQIDDIPRKLARIGCEAVPLPVGGALAEFTDAEVEVMAEMEHGRWTVERLRSHWVFAERRDPAQRRSPYLVSWADLPEGIREFDRAAVRRIPELLAAAGMSVRRLPSPAAQPARDAT